jgi:hypothetical protein
VEGAEVVRGLLSEDDPAGGKAVGDGGHSAALPSGSGDGSVRLGAVGARCIDSAL